MSEPYANIIRERALPVPAETVPTLRWPRDRHLVPRVCANCREHGGGGLLDLDESRGETAPARIYCVTCSTDVCWLVRERGR